MVVNAIRCNVSAISCNANAIWVQYHAMSKIKVFALYCCCTFWIIKTLMTDDYGTTLLLLLSHTQTALFPLPLAERCDGCPILTQCDYNYCNIQCNVESMCGGQCNTMQCKCNIMQCQCNLSAVSMQCACFARD